VPYTCVALDVPLVLKIVDLAISKQDAEDNIGAQGKVEETGTNYTIRNFMACVSPVKKYESGGECNTYWIREMHTKFLQRLRTSL